MTNYYELLMDDGESLDLYDVTEFPIDLSFFLLDPSKIEKRGGAASNTFKIPATKKNNLKFQHFGTTGAYGNAISDFIKLRGIRLNVGGANVANGFLRGKSHVFDSKPKYYEVMFQGENKDWSDLLSEKKLIELPFPTVDWSQTVVENSWANTWEDCYTSPMCFYGMKNNVPQNKLFMDYGDFRYWHFARWVVEEMFKSIGWKIHSNFIESADFSKFITYHNDLDFYATNPSEVNLGSNLILDERTCMQYLKGIVEFFNLQIHVVSSRREIYIEQFNDFFLQEFSDKSNFAKENWTSKLDTSKENVFAPFSEEQQKSKSVGLKQDCLSEFIQESYNPLYDEYQIFSQDNIDLYITNYGYNRIIEPYYTHVLGNEPADKKINLFYASGFEDADIKSKSENSYFSGFFSAFIISNYKYALNPNAIEYYDYSRSLSVPLILDSISDPTDLPELQGGGNPRIAYYAGVKWNQPLMNYGLHFGESDGLPEYQSTIAGDGNNSHEYNAFVWEWHGNPMKERPLAYLCDYAYEDGGKNFHYSNQHVDIAAYEFILDTEFHEDKVKLEFQKQIVMDGTAFQLYGKLFSSIKNSRTLKGYFKQSPFDISNLDFRKLKTVQHRDFILYEVTKWNPLVDMSTQCRLLEFNIPTENSDSYLLAPNHVLYVDFPR